jgi:hypothetical protein
VVKSSNKNTEVIVSDNSESDSIQKICHEQFPSIRYIRRSQPRTGPRHFKAILDEATSEYLVLFHDDDIMLPNYISTLLPYIEANPLISAVGCNAEIIDKTGKATGKFFIRNLKQPLFISNADQLITSYIRSTGIAPFPGYMYRRKYIRSSFINYKHGGKYADVSFLLKILQRAAMVWHSEPLMHYRNHGDNDSATESIPDRLSLIRYLMTHEGMVRNSPEMRYFKFIYWANWWRSRDNFFLIPNGWREKVVFHFLAHSSVKLIFFDSAFRKLLLYKFANLIKLRVR